MVGLLNVGSRAFRGLHLVSGAGHGFSTSNLEVAQSGPQITSSSLRSGRNLPASRHQLSAPGGHEDWTASPDPLGLSLCGGELEGFGQLIEHDPRLELGKGSADAAGIAVAPIGAWLRH
jgi:hypothetical protein